MYLAVGTVRRSRVYTRRLAALCMFAVAEENLNQLPPPIYPLYPLSPSLYTLLPPSNGFNPGFFLRHATFLPFPPLFHASPLHWILWTGEEKRREARKRRRRRRSAVHGGRGRREGNFRNRRGRWGGGPSIGINFQTT